MDIFRIGKSKLYSIHSNEIAVKLKCSNSTFRDRRGSRSKEPRDESCGFRQSTSFTTQFSVPNPAVFLLSKKLFFSIYLCTYIDDKKPYKPFNQLDTSSRHTASPSPVNKELHFFFGKFIIFVEIQNRLFFRLRTHLKINRTIIGTMIWWSVNPYYTLLPPHKKKKKSQLPAICQFGLLYISIQSRFDHKSDRWSSSLSDVCLDKEKKTPNIVCFVAPKLFDNCFDLLFSSTASFSFLYLSLFRFDFGRIRTVFYSPRPFLVLLPLYILRGLAFH